MRKLSGLWQSLEEIPSLATIPAFWKVYCGEDFSLIEPFLRPTDVMGVAYPCPHPTHGYCPRKIIDFDDGEYVAICRQPWTLWRDLRLPLKEVRVHELDVAAFTRAIAGPLGIRWHQPQEKLPHGWAFGVSPSRSRLHLAAYLICAYSQLAFRGALRDLLLDSPNAFVAVAPTRNYLTAELQEHVTARRCDFVSLAESIGIDERGQFAAIETLASGEALHTPVDQRERIVNEFKEKFAYTVDVICQDAQVHRSDFYKWLRGELADHLGKSKRIEDLLRSDPTQRSYR